MTVGWDEGWKIVRTCKAECGPHFYEVCLLKKVIEMRIKQKNELKHYKSYDLEGGFLYLPTSNRLLLM